MTRKRAAAAGPRLSPVRARTRDALLDAAVRVFARQNIGDTSIHALCEEAGVSVGSFYNYYRTREEVVEAAAALLSKRLVDEISASSAKVTDPAVQVSIGARRFMLKALEDPVWGAAVLRVWGTTPSMGKLASQSVMADLRAGKKAGVFKFESEVVAVNLLQGTTLAAMRTLLDGSESEAHVTAVAAIILRGLGVPDRSARAIAARPLPRFVSPPPRYT